MTSADIIDVSEINFEYEVLTFSQQMPVVVDFWAEWCQPCKVLDPILKRLAEESEGAFRLAKVDVDQNPNLAIRYNVSGIPSVKAFRNGEVISEFTGALPEAKVREFLGKLMPSSGDLILEKAHSLLKDHQWKAAEQTYQGHVSARESPAGNLGLVKSLLAQGEGRKALAILDNFPSGKEYLAAEQLRPLTVVLNQLGEFPIVGGSELDATYAHSLKLVKMGNIYAAMDGMLDILRKDKKFRDGEVHQVILGFLLILGEENQVTRDYRRELASILF